MVVVEESTDAFAPVNPCVRVRGWWRPFQQLVVESLMVPLAVAMLDVFVDDEA